MNREIKFRGWNKVDKEMIEIWDINFKDGYAGAENKDGGVYDIDNKDIELLQFTGLLDKNGKQIYEGDIVKNTATFHDLDSLCESFLTDKLFFEIYWCEGEAQFRMKNDEIEQHFNLSGRTLEVIGNIFENPELVEEFGLGKFMEDVC